MTNKKGIGLPANKGSMTPIGSEKKLVHQDKDGFSKSAHSAAVKSNNKFNNGYPHSKGIK